jgi:phosphoenolpyruvate carboxykinase (ATP)
MQNTGINPSRFGLSEHGLRDITVAHWNLTAPQLVEEAVRRYEGALADNGALVVRTGQFTGRSPTDKFAVRDRVTEPVIHWGQVNRPMTEEAFDKLYSQTMAHFSGKEVFVHDCYGGADPAYRLRIRLVNELAWHSLFARQLFVRPHPEEMRELSPEFTLFFAPSLKVNPAELGVNSETCIALSFGRRAVIIAGTSYAGEMKKSVFTILNHLLPDRGVMPMHCSANTSESGEVALFFGLSGTGKTTLSADPKRRLIGDDEHGWSDKGVFNFEGGCYAKCIRLSQEKEPQIWNAIKYGAVLENVAMDPEFRTLDYNSDAITENTRAAYPLDFIENAVTPSVGGHPSHVVFLTADAFGVLPPIARLTPEQAMYHFLSGYTAKVAGTERGLGKEPQATFSACFGAPFLPRHPEVYARMLGEKLRLHRATVWLVNTGWIGGPFGIGERMNLRYTRAMVNAAISSKLDDVPVTPHPVFQVLVPHFCPEVPSDLLDARSLWTDPSAYDRAAQDLSARFRKNFDKFGGVQQEILEAAPAG